MKKEWVKNLPKENEKDFEGKSRFGKGDEEETSTRKYFKDYDNENNEDDDEPRKFFKDW